MNQDISPIDLAKAITPHWMRNIRDFDGLEIQPCAVLARCEEGAEIAEPSEPEDAAFWTVYGHFRSGGVDAFEDFATEAEALAFRDRLIATYPHLAGQCVQAVS